ncbi:LytTR family transcriptional regulator DNA-binding domain-containing protein [Psychrobacillus sp. NEAU-3TGS]|uniref:LytTR family transcriptional regulator DNA-binding domain-containing protein n=1 Tax=Psychrobacillus sp. NEAU-3TGS TaxID=2995412 RepID=UPI002498FD21|nr:LytTR family transcriptional regulator DNA-binding domain-containing protein [Psychrobacillus sp. NEAU-3TGS]MDI2589181.1 LytTR family transcriptional regulator DNA-binding domain-containing protein [Psychrobacillus sp. NEAU-3TGS]
MSLKFIQAEKQVYDSIVFPAFDLTIAGGEVTAICSNVNIREQLIEIILGRNFLSNGEIQYADEKKLAFFFLHEGLHERLTVQEFLKFYHQLYQSKQSIEEITRLVQLDSKKNKKIKDLTYSEKKRAQLAYILIQNAETYIMEEPDQNLDVESKRIFIAVFNELRKLNKTVLVLTSHLETAVTVADKIVRLDDKGLQIVQTEEEHPEELHNVNVIESETEEKIVQPIRFEKIPTKVNEKIVLFDPPEIDYIESTEGQTFLHIKGESFPCTFTLNELEERLYPFGFFRCHRSYIVNLQKVREVITWTRNSYSLVLDDALKSSVPLSKTKMADLKGMLGLK